MAGAGEAVLSICKGQQDADTTQAPCHATSLFHH